MRILCYLSGFFAFFIALSMVLNAAPVQAGGCAGGQCGVTATITPPNGPVGTQVTITVQTGAFPLDGKYELWWSRSSNMDPNDVTVVKVAEGWNERQKMSFTTSLSIPSAPSGVNYIHYIKAGRTENMMNFSFTIIPDIIAKESSIRPRSTATIAGTGFAALDKVKLYIDGEPSEIATNSDQMGNFTASLPIPDLAGGTHVIKATSDKLFNQEASLRFKIAPSLKLEPEFPLVGKTATVSGFGFAAESEVSIKFDNIVITSSPTSDKSGRFVYNFTVPESSEGRHKLTATDKSGNIAVFETPIENNAPSTPTPVYPTSDRFGIFGSQLVTFNWMPAKDDSGSVVYTIEIADNLNFFPLAPGMRRTNLDETTVSVPMEPGTYYWRVQAADASGNKSKWALSPYAFQVGMINIWVIVAVSVILLVIFILLLRAFIQRVRGYYY
ncbi:MAG: hypothetical protein PHO26_10580 [Dehalococcoidia bacterium]|nr:hypothetical protein [Dehalococcoidia bacterium]